MHTVRMRAARGAVVTTLVGALVAGVGGGASAAPREEGVVAVPASHEAAAALGAPEKTAAGAGGGFSDVISSHPFFDDITWMRETGVTTGYTDGTFRSLATVSRDAMAAFLYRATTGQPKAPPCTAAPFWDVPTNHPFCGEIAWLAGTGVTTGHPDGSYRPAQPVSREAMAAFLYRLRNDGGTAPACTTTPFGDVRTVDRFCGEIAWLAATEIAGGWPDRTFRPGRDIERQAMARFMHRLDALPRPAAPGLRVEVTDLPEGVAAAVVVTGPDGVPTHLTGTTDIADAAVGAWTVTAENVVVADPGGDLTYAPTITPATVTLTPDAGATVTVSYFTVVSDATVVLPEGSVLAVDRAVSPTSVTLGASAGVEVGDVLVSDVTAAAPYGMLVRVTALAGDDPVVATVEPATITDAVPRGHLVADAAFTAANLDSGLAGTGRAPDAAAAGTEAAATAAAARSNPIMDAISDNFECEFDADDVEFDSEFEFEGGLELDFEWGDGFWEGLDSAELSGWVSQYAELVFEAELEAGCELKEVELLATPWRMGTFTVWLSFVPVVIVPEVQLYLDGSFEVTGRIVTGVTESFDAEAGVRYDGEAFHPVGGPPEIETEFLPPKPQVTAEADAGVRAELRMEIYGAAGPYLSVRPGLSFQADTLDDPWWQLYATLGISAGMLAEALDWEYETGEFVSIRHLLASAPEPPDYVDYGEVPYRMLQDDGNPDAPSGEVTMHLEPGQIGRLTCVTGGRSNGNGQWGYAQFSRASSPDNDTVTLVTRAPSGEWENVLRTGEGAQTEGAMLEWEDATVLVMPSGETTDIVVSCDTWFYT